jgi:hypothetical protein
MAKERRRRGRSTGRRRRRRGRWRAERMKAHRLRGRSCRRAMGPDVSLHGLLERLYLASWKRHTPKRDP